MEPPRPISQRAQRLREIAHELNAVLSEDTSKLTVPLQCRSFRTPQDEQGADAVLFTIRVEEAATQQPSNGLKRAFSSKKPSQYTEKDFRTALTRVIDQNGSVGVAEVLLGRLRSLGVDLNVARRSSHGVFKMGRKADNDEKRSRLLQTAVELDRLDFVQLLGPLADQANLDAALPIAIGRNIPEMIELLLRYGANPALCQGQFRAAAASGDANLVSLLLRSPKPVGLQCITESLLAAVTCRSLRVVLLLVQAGADGNFQEGSALLRSIETEQMDMAAVIVGGSNPPSGQTLDLALTSVFSQPAVNLIEKLMITDILLCGGPEGNAANVGLIIATRMGCVPMMQLLLEARASVNYDTASAVRHAIVRGRKDWVEILLQTQKLDPQIASETVREIDRKAPSEVKVAMASILLTQGASGYHVNELLVRAVQSDDLVLAELLVSNKASVEYDGAKGLTLAVSRSRSEMVAILLRGSPLQFSLAAAFRAIPKGNQEDRHRMTRALLEAGARGSEIDFALRDVITSQDQPPNFIELLVDHGADVNGETFVKAVSQGFLPVLKILLKGRPLPTTISAAVPVAMKLQHNTTRYQILRAILREALAIETGKQEIAQALIDTIRNWPEDEPLAQLLCREGKADINYNGGLAAVKAAECQNPRILDIVLQCAADGASPETISNALSAVMPLPATRERLHKIEVLLHGEKPQKALDEALVKEICWALATPRDLSAIQILLVAGADVNYANGAAVCHAVRNPAILDMILVRHPTADSLSLAFPLAMALTDFGSRLAVCEKLLKAGASGEEISKALCTVAKEVPSDVRLMQLILPQADVNYSDGRALRMVVRRKQTESLGLILNQRPNMIARLRGMQEAMKIDSNPDRRVVVKMLLDAGTRGEMLSDALSVAVNSGDRELAELFIKSGASVEYRGAQTIISAASSGDKEILKLLIGGTSSQRPSLSALTAGFGAASALKEKDKNNYHDTLEVLLGAGMRGAPVDDALIEAVKEGDSNLKTTDMIYHHGASVEFRDGEAIDAATRGGFIETLRLLLSATPSENVLKRAFRSALKLSGERRYVVVGLIMTAKKSIDKHVTNALLSATQASPPDHRFIRLLLDFEVFDDGQSLAYAASTLDIETLKLLLSSPKSTEFSHAALNDLIATGTFWQTQRGLDVAEVMLQRGAGAGGESAGAALATAVERYCDDLSDPLAKNFFDLFLCYEADVNYHGGLALQKAAQKANLEVLTSLLPDATSESKCMAFPYLFTSAIAADETAILQMIDAFTDTADAESTLDIDFTHPDPQIDPVLFMALSQFPRKKRVLKALLDAGLNPHVTKLYELNPRIGKETVPLLCWALDQPQKKISSDNIIMLVETGVDVNFSSKSNITPVMLCIHNNRPDILGKLLELGAKVTVVDEHGITPLATASRLGNAEVMGLLLKAGAETDDGSLHDAARQLRLDAMQVLIKYGHEVDYPSDRHEGRSALAELCLGATDNGKLEEAIELLLSEGSKISLQHVGGKTVFHYALDSANPLPVLRVLLKLAWKYINDDAFLYAYGPCTYSLTMYVAEDLYLGPKAQKAEILRLLRTKRARDRLWATNITDPQPSNMVNPPDAVRDEVLAQQARAKRRAEEHQDVLHRNNLKQIAFVAEEEILGQQAQSLNRREYDASRARQQNRETEAAQALRLSSTADAEVHRQIRSRQALEMEHMKAVGQREVQNQRMIGAEQVRNQKAIGEAKIELEGTARMLALEFEDERQRKENEGLRSRLAIESGEREKAENSQGRLHDKEMARLRLKSEMMSRMERISGGLQAAGANQRQIGYVMGEIQ